MKKLKKQKKLRAKLAKAAPKPKRKYVRRKPLASDGGLQRDIANALAYKKKAMAAEPIPAPEPKPNGHRLIPTSFKFQQEDIDLLNRLKIKFGTDSRIEVVRKAMHMAASEHEVEF